MQPLITEREAKSRFTEILNAARKSPVAITEEGRETVFLLSSDEYAKHREHYRWKLPEMAQKKSAANGQAEEKDAWDELMDRIDGIAVDTGISDLAHNHDHYLLGLPKR
uniref:Prevent-host-death family protein n=1 Tax=Candidatus Kentrum sp. DK TaxID=2126562 RepID=A0A450TQ91_9GAMM|nr:MAG: prevent-host-death family protein [Candidatus Kentron sp. DK]